MKQKDKLEKARVFTSGERIFIRRSYYTIFIYLQFPHGVRRRSYMKKKFKLFDFTKEGKGVRKEDYVEDTPFTLPTFFKTFFRNFWSFSCLNFLYLLINFPLFCPKCKKETLINIVKLKMTVSE